MKRAPFRANQSNDEMTWLLSASHVWKSAQKRGSKYVHYSVGGLCVFYAINCREERLGDTQKLGAAHCRLWLLPLIFRYMPCLYWHTGIKVICQRREGGRPWVSHNFCTNVTIVHHFSTGRQWSLKLKDIIMKVQWVKQRFDSTKTWCAWHRLRGMHS